MASKDVWFLFLEGCLVISTQLKQYFNISILLFFNIFFIFSLFQYFPYFNISIIYWVLLLKQNLFYQILKHSINFWYLASKDSWFLSWEGWPLQTQESSELTRAWGNVEKKVKFFQESLLVSIFFFPLAISAEVFQGKAIFRSIELLEKITGQWNMVLALVQSFTISSPISLANKSTGKFFSFN